jgi:hypothetical protein
MPTTAQAAPSVIYCVSHKPCRFPVTPAIKVLQTGDGPERFGAIVDSTGDNIAAKNPYYSELTGFYQVWKNHPAPAVGFCHYRRYLLPLGEDAWLQANALRRWDSGYLVKEDTLMAHLDSQPDYAPALFGLLDNADIVLPRPLPVHPGGLLRQYASAHPPGPLLRMIALLTDANPTLGRRIVEFFTLHPQAYWNNLFVTRWDLFDRYCQLLFPLLARLEREIPLPDSMYQQRIFAFLSERLFNFWVWHHGLKVVEVEWCMVEDQASDVDKHQAWFGKGHGGGGSPAVRS